MKLQQAITNLSHADDCNIRRLATMSGYELNSQLIAYQVKIGWTQEEAIKYIHAACDEFEIRGLELI